jgi:hypothetical protein
MKKISLIAVLIIVAMLLFSCGSNDAAPAPPAEPATIEVVVDTAAFEAAVAALADAVEALDGKVDALGENFAEEPPVTTDETGGGDAVILDEDREPLTTYITDTDEDGNPVTLACGLAEVINSPAYMLQKAMNDDGTFKENKAGYPIMQKVPHMGPMPEDYVCVDSPPLRVDGGSVFRLQYAQQEDKGDHDEWRGLGADWNQCCFIGFDDVQRETYP